MKGWVKFEVSTKHHYIDDSKSMRALCGGYGLKAPRETVDAAPEDRCALCERKLKEDKPL